MGLSARYLLTAVAFAAFGAASMFVALRATTNLAGGVAQTGNCIRRDGGGFRAPPHISKSNSNSNGSSISSGSSRAAATNSKQPQFHASAADVVVPLLKAGASRRPLQPMHDGGDADEVVAVELERDVQLLNLTDEKRQRFMTRARLNAFGQRWVRRLRAPTPAMAACRRVVATMSTIPPRIGRLHKLIEAIKHQEYGVDAIYLGVPLLSTRLGERYRVPEYLSGDPAVTIVHLPADYGPLSKLAAALIAESDPDACIVTYVTAAGYPCSFVFLLTPLCAQCGTWPLRVMGRSRRRHSRSRPPACHRARLICNSPAAVLMMTLSPRRTTCFGW